MLASFLETGLSKNRPLNELNRERTTCKEKGFAGFALFLLLQDRILPSQVAVEQYEL